jgi:hypothetical protein
LGDVAQLEPVPMGDFMMQGVQQICSDVAGNSASENFDASRTAVSMPLPWYFGDLIRALAHPDRRDTSVLQKFVGEM